MKLATPEQMREMDRIAIEERGVPGIVLMENAGAAVAREAFRLLELTGSRRVHVLCGPGNNGGDGFVAARHLAALGVPVSYQLVGEPERIRGDARVNFNLVRALGVTVSPIIPADAVVIDALLGTGTAGAPRGSIAEAIVAIRQSGRPVVAVDVPSGVDAGTGAVPGEAVRADVTVTLGLAKPGLLLYPGASYVGRLVVDRIGMDWNATGVELTLQWFDREEAVSCLPPRPADAHKGNFGHVLIVGGSRGMTGAPVLAALGALRGGAGLVTVAVPVSAHPMVAAHLKEAMYVPLPDEDGMLCPASWSLLEKALRRATVVCVGPGLGRGTATSTFVRLLIERCALPLVIDADALWAASEHRSVFEHRNGVTVLTPHPGEASLLLDTSISHVQADRVTAARELARRCRAVAILKGAGTVVCDGRGASSAEDDGGLPVSLITTGNPGMATGGSGDVLTGIVGAFIAQGLDPYTAACLGAYVHGRAGDCAAVRRGWEALTAGDIADTLGEALKELRE